MKIDDLVLLIKAGYSKADIEQLGISVNASENKTAEIAGQEVIEEVKEKEVPKEESNLFDDRFKALDTKVDYVINRLNYMSVQNSEQPNEKTESLEDILNSIIK